MVGRGRRFESVRGLGSVDSGPIRVVDVLILTR
jgi:hypothetical protein